MWLIIWCPLSPNGSLWIFLNHVKTTVQSSAQTFWVKCKSFAFKCNKCTQLEVLACTKPVNTLFQILLCMWHILCGWRLRLGMTSCKDFFPHLFYILHTILLQSYTVARMYYIKYQTFFLSQKIRLKLLHWVRERTKGWDLCLVGMQSSWVLMWAEQEYSWQALFYERNTSSNSSIDCSVKTAALYYSLV